MSVRTPMSAKIEEPKVPRRTRRRLAATAVLVAAMVAVVAGASLATMHRLARQSASAARADLASIESAARARARIADLMALEGDVALAAGRDPDGSQGAWNEADALFVRDVHDVEGTAASDVDRALLPELRRALGAYEGTFRQVAARVRSGEITSAADVRAAMEPSRAAAATARKQVDAILDDRLRVADARAARVDDKTWKGAAAIATLAFFALVVVAAAEALFLRGVTRPLARFARDAALAAGGGTKLEARDEIGFAREALDAMRGALRRARHTIELLERDRLDEERRVVDVWRAVAEVSAGDARARAPAATGVVGDLGAAFNALMDQHQAKLARLEAAERAARAPRAIDVRPEPRPEPVREIPRAEVA